MAIGLAGIAVAGTLTGVVMSVSASSSPPAKALGLGPSFLQTLSSYSAVYTGSDGVHVVPFDGRPASRALAAASSAPVQTSDGAVFLSAGQAYFLSAPFGSSPRALVPADQIFPMVWPGVIGVGRHLSSGAVQINFVELDGQSSLDTTLGTLPAGYQPVAQSLAVGPGGDLRTWDAAIVGVVELGPSLGRASSVIGVSGTTFAWLGTTGCVSDGECPLLVSANETAPGQLIPAPAGHAGYLPGGALSPAGDMIAAFIAGSRHTAQLAIIDLANASTDILPGSVPAGAGELSADWSPDGTLVVFAGSNGILHVYPLNDGKTAALKVKVSGRFAVG